MSELPVSVTVPGAGVSTPLLGSGDLDLDLAEATLAPARATVTAMSTAVVARATASLRFTGRCPPCRVLRWSKYERGRADRNGRRPWGKRVGESGRLSR